MTLRIVLGCIVLVLLFVLVKPQFQEFSAKISHNQRYKIIPEWTELNYLNSSLGNVSVKSFVYNRTTKAINMTFNFYTRLTVDSTIFVMVYQWRSNQYKLTAMQFPFKIYQMMQMQWFGLETVTSLATPQMTWPLKQHVFYHITNWVPDSSRIPYMYGTEGKIKANIAWFVDDMKNKLCDYDHFLTIERGYYPMEN